MLRESILLNGILTNIEIWHPLNGSQIEVFKDVALLLIRKLLEGHSKASKETLFMETGLLPFKSITIKAYVFTDNPERKRI